MIEEADKSFIEKHADDLENYFYNEDGNLIHIEENLGGGRFIVSQAYAVTWDDGEYYSGGSELELGTQYVYTGKLYDYKSYAKLPIKHDELISLECKCNELRDEISTLQSKKSEMERFATLNRDIFARNDLFLKTFDLLNNQKRFVFIRDTKWRYYIVDLMDKKVLSESLDPEDEWPTSTRFKEVKFTIYKDYNRYSNLKDDMYNFKIHLINDTGKSYGENITNLDNVLPEDIIEFDDLNELQAIVDKLFFDDKLDINRYIQIISNFKLKINNDIAILIKDRMIDIKLKQKEHKENYLKQYNNEVELLDNEIKEYENIDLNKETNDLIKLFGSDLRLY